MVKVICHKCEYEWETNSQMFFVTCPSCRIKTKRIKEETSQKQQEGDDSWQD